MGQTADPSASECLLEVSLRGPRSADEKTSTKRLSHLPEVAQLGRGGGENRTPVLRHTAKQSSWH